MVSGSVNKSMDCVPITLLLSLALLWLMFYRSVKYRTSKFDWSEEPVETKWL